MPTLLTPRRALQEAMWEHLNNSTDYTSMGLKEYKFFNGVFLPADWKKGRIDGDLLPAIQAMPRGGGRSRLGQKSGGQSNEGGGGIQQTFFHWIALQVYIIYSSDKGDGTAPSDTSSADRIDHAMTVIADCFDTRIKRMQLCALMGTKWATQTGSPPGGGSFTWGEHGAYEVGKNGIESGEGRLWAWSFDITLKGPSFHL